MFTTVFIAILILGSTAAFWIAPRFYPDPAEGEKRNPYSTDPASIRNGIKIGAAIVGAVGWLILAFSMLTIVDDGKVGVTRAFGEYGSETLEPGINIIMPWETVRQIDTRVTSYTFSDDEKEAISGPISAQALGGGNLRIEHTVQLQVDKSTADNLLREVSGEWFDTVILPPIRSCTRDAPTSLTLEEAYTSERATIGLNIQGCVEKKVGKYGITIVDVLIRDVDPGKAVRQSIDAKQQAEQDLQRAAIQTRVVEEEARQESIRSFGISNAEQIVACGGMKSVTDDGKTVIVPNTVCEDQFSFEYLQWLYINQLSKIQGAVILPPEFNGNLFVNPPQPQGQTK